jgi:hypothetical protein
VNQNANFYILGRIQVIPEQKILEGLLLSKGVKQENIQIIYDDLGSSARNLENLFKILSRKNIDNILIVTAPYFTKRTSLLWSKYSDKIEANYYKTVDWPDNKLSLFKNSNNKKTILYEHFAILYNYLNRTIK